MAPFSQELEPPPNPGRFKAAFDGVDRAVIGGPSCHPQVMFEI
jgi:hypothetical protein